MSDKNQPGPIETKRIVPCRTIGGKATKIEQHDGVVVVVLGADSDWSGLRYTLSDFLLLGAEITEGVLRLADAKATT